LKQSSSVQLKLLEGIMLATEIRALTADEISQVSGGGVTGTVIGGIVGGAAGAAIGSRGGLPGLIIGTAVGTYVGARIGSLFDQ
jgi:hypothetical protein